MFHAGHYQRKLHTRAGEVMLKTPNRFEAGRARVSNVSVLLAIRVSMEVYRKILGVCCQAQTYCRNQRGSPRLPEDLLKEQEPEQVLEAAQANSNHDGAQQRKKRNLLDGYDYLF